MRQRYGILTNNDETRLFDRISKIVGVTSISECPSKDGDVLPVKTTVVERGVGCPNQIGFLLRKLSGDDNAEIINYRGPAGQVYVAWSEDKRLIALCDPGTDSYGDTELIAFPEVIVTYDIIVPMSQQKRAEGEH